VGYLRSFSVSRLYITWIDIKLERSSHGLIKVVPQELHGRTEENHEKPHSG
jgi:hypothetical protein